MSKQDNSRIDKLIRKAGGIIGKTRDSTELYHKRTPNKLMDILQDNTQPLRLEFIAG